MAIRFTDEEAVKFMRYNWNDIEKILDIMQKNQELFNLLCGDNIFIKLADFLTDYVEKNSKQERTV